MRVKGLFGLLLTLALTAGCQTSTSGPSLLTLTGLSPTELELGDELELSGAGFPEGKPARVVFRGDLYRAGIQVNKDREIVARTTSLSPRSLTLAVSDELRQAFTGSGDEARHTTFRGDIEVSFAPKKAGSAPVTGTLPDVLLDVEPPLLSPLLSRQRDAIADEALAFLGLELRPTGEGDCCVVSGVEGRAAAAGVKAGDRLLELDGVNVKSRWDLVPSSSRRTSRLTFRSEAGGPAVARELDVQGYHSAAPSELGPALGIVGFLVGLLLMESTRLGRPSAWLGRWLSQRLRERASPCRPGRSRGKRGFSPKSEWFALPEDPRYHLLGSGLLVGLLAVSLALSLRMELVSRELDLLLWCLLQTVSVVWASCLVMARQRSKPLRSAVRAAGSILLHQLPLLTLVVGSIFEVQSLRLLDLVDAQGPSPLGWTSFRSPAWLLLTLLAIAALVPTIEPAPLRRTSDTPAEGRVSSLAFGLGRVLAGTAHLWSTATLLSLVAFGGFRLPGLSATAQSMSVAWQLGGAALLLLKAWGVVSLVLALRYVVGELRIEDSLGPFLRYGVGLVLLGAVVALAWVWVGRTLGLGWLGDVTAWVLLSTTLATTGNALYRAVVRSRATRSEAGVNPWI